MGETVVTTKGGRPLTVPDDKVQSYLDRGYTIASPELQQQVKDEETYGGWAQGAAGLGTGILSGATLGISDLAIAELAPGGREYLQMLEKYHGLGRTAGSVIGGVAPLFLPGGQGSLLARGAKVVSAPARGLAALAEGTSALVGGGIKGLAAGAALEGGVIGIGDTVAEAAIYDKDLTGEMLAASALKGAGIGAVGGAAFGGAGALFTKTHGKVNDLISRSLRKASGDPGVGAYVLSRLAGGDDRLAQKIARFSEEKALTRAQNIDDELLGHVNEATDGTERVFNALQQAHKEGVGELKASAVADLIPGGHNPARYAAAQEAVNEAEGIVGTLQRHARDVRTVAADGSVVVSKAFVDPKGLAALQRDVQAVKKHLSMSQEYASSGSARTDAELHVAVDNLKRSVGDLAYNKIGADVTSPAAQESFQTLDYLYEKQLRPMLENTELWGRAGSMQADVNASWKKFIETSKRTGVGNKLGRKYAGDKGVDQWAFRRDEAFSKLKNLDADESKQLVEDLSEYLNDGAEFANTMSQYRSATNISQDVSADVARARRAMDNIKEARQLRADFKELQAYSKDYDHAAGFLGYVIAGYPGSIIAGSVRNPYGVVTKLGVSRAIAKGVESAISSNVSRMAQMATAAAAVKVNDRRKKYKELEAGLRLYGQNREASALEAEDAFMGLRDHAPGATQKAVDTFMARQDFLLSKLPQGRYGSGGRYLGPSDDEIRTFMRYVRGVADPTAVVKDIVAGTLDDETIEAVRTVYPATYEYMRYSVAEEWGTMVAENKKLPYNQRIRVGRLLELDTDPTLDLHLLNIVNAGYAANPDPEAPPPRRPPQNQSMARHYRKDTDRLMQENE